ncbi:hypothetical protein OSB04_018834 [Centaurea solstitialis]|uniref:CCHC-type domain-containing protein n=1 Tax=Centaurea solstitialis TaxID=347529 RepID=A0AA38WFA5_9ASTR|nr:hypothetical protein OSB04_018834 [Centaurea solstitialis]
MKMILYSVPGSLSVDLSGLSYGFGLLDSNDRMAFLSICLSTVNLERLSKGRLLNACTVSAYRVNLPYGMNMTRNRILPGKSDDMNRESYPKNCDNRQKEISFSNTMSSPNHSQSEYSADASGYVTVRPRANSTSNQDRAVSDEVESHHDASVEPKSDSDSSDLSIPVLPRPTPTMPESSRGPRIRVTAGKSVPIPRRAFADRTEALAPPRVVTGIPIGRAPTWAQEQQFRAAPSGLQSCQPRVDYQSQVITELVERTHFLTEAYTEALDTARVAIGMASVARDLFGDVLKMIPRRSPRNPGGTSEGQNPDIAQIIAQQIQAAIPNIVTQVTAGINVDRRNDRTERGNLNNDNNNVNNTVGCNYKTFMSCKPKEFYGKEGVVGLLTWIDSLELVLHISKCAEDRKVEYASCQLQGRALTWWNIQVQTRGRENAYRLSWEEFKGPLIEEYCPKSEIQKLEAEFWNHAMVGADIDRYTARFHELAKLVPHMVTPENKRIDRYLWGLAPEIRGMVTSSNPTTIQAVVALATTLTNDAVRAGTLKLGSVGSKRKSEFQSGKRLQGNTSKGKQVVRAFGVKAQEVGRNSGNYPRCNQCNLHHGGACIMCNLASKKVGKNTKIGGRVCYECGSPDHFRNVCPRLGRGVNNISTGNQARPTNKETRVDLLEEEHSPLINLKSKKLPTTYIVEVANGFELEATEVILGCALKLADRTFSVDLMPIKLGSFDVVIGMDWLSKNRAHVDCYEKAIWIPLQGGETLIVQGDRPGKELRLMSCIKAHKYLRKKYFAFVALVSERKSEERRIQDIPVVKDYLEVFHDNFPGLPPPRQVEFQIDLVPGAAPVAKAPYRLAPTEMQELSNQLQELLDK